MGLHSASREDRSVELEKEYSDWELFRRYIQRIWPYKKSVFLISSFILISTIIDIIIPIIFGAAVDELETGSPNYQQVLFLGLVYLVLSLITWISFSLRRREVGNFTPYFLAELRMDIFSKLQEQDLSFYDKHLSGSLNSRVTNDALDFSSTTLLITDNLGNFLVSIITFGILLWLNPILALITVSGIPVLFVLMFSLRRLARRVSRAYRKAIGEINDSMVESIEGIQVSKSYGQEATVSDRFLETNKNYFGSAFRLTAVTHMWRSVLDTITAVILAIVIYLGSQYVTQGVLRVSTVLMFILYIQRFFRPITSLATFFPELSAGMAAFERICSILDAEPNVQQNESTIEVEDLEGSIELQDVYFSYKASEDEETVFNGLNLKIEPNEHLAVVGHTGAGKSSLVKLIARFYEFQDGSITIDGMDIRDLDLESYRKNLGIVEQDIFLFKGTIEENIRYGRTDASEGDLEKVIQAVQLDELVDYLDKGLQSEIGERGKGLSSGQKQLISFARALLTDPSILILDEATASVDAYTEAMIQEALEVLLTDRTSIVVAHRLSTIVNADRIIVMDNGKIVEQGNHTTLLQQGGKYAELYKTYYEHQSADWEPDR